MKKQSNPPPSVERPPAPPGPPDINVSLDRKTKKVDVEFKVTLICQIEKDEDDVQ